ncbi:MAG: hypothetical protein ACO1N1_20210 [Dyadobacter fermentans]
MARILIIGRIPPPVGGVAVHVRRLTDSLRRQGFPFEFCDLGKEQFFRLLLKILRHPVIHIHFSNPRAQLIFAVFCKLTFKKLIITYHGCWGRYGWLGNWAVRLSARLAHVPIVQDRTSLKQALRQNPRTCKISTYIHDVHVEPLPAGLQNELWLLRMHYKAIFCTNAWNITFDKYGREIYGISELIARFEGQAEFLLLISDPSGNYRSYIETSYLHIPGNVFFITGLHDFRSVLLQSDAFIRNTTTDGVSLSVHEARELGIAVLASAAVARPPFCYVFEDFPKTDLERSLEEARRLITLPGEMTDTVAELTALYRTVLNVR